MERLDAFYTKHLKWIFGVKQQTANTAVFLELDQLSLQCLAQIAIIK